MYRFDKSPQVPDWVYSNMAKNTKVGDIICMPHSNWGSDIHSFLAILKRRGLDINHYAGYKTHDRFKVVKEEEEDAVT